jgi:hypothetical protein
MAIQLLRKILYVCQYLFKAHLFLFLLSWWCRSFIGVRQVPSYDALRIVAKMKEKYTVDEKFDWVSLYAKVHSRVRFKAVPPRCSFGAGR